MTMLWRVFWLILLVANANSQNTDLNFVGLFPNTGAWPLGNVIEAGAMLGISDITSNPWLLKNLPGGNYTLRLFSNDTVCTPGVGVLELVNQIVKGPPKVGIVGPGCSAVSIAVADLAKYWNLNLISFANTPTLSNKDLYDDFWRIQPNDNYFANAWLALGKLFGWRRFFAIREDNSLFNLPIGHFQGALQNESVTDPAWNLASSEVFPADKPEEIHSHVTQLKQKGARIIVGGFYEGNCRRVLCAAYKQGLSWRNGVIWILPGWFADGWQNATQEELNGTPDIPAMGCTQEELTDATLYIIQTTAIGFADDSTPLTYLSEKPSEWAQRWAPFRYGYDPTSLDMYWGPLAYDSMWAWGLAFHNYILNNNSISDLLTYDNVGATTILRSHLRELDFNSVSGRVKFDEYQDRPLPISIDVTSEGQKLSVGVFVDDKITMTSEMIWPDGTTGMDNIPPDQRISTYHIPLAVQIPLLVFGAILLVLLIACLVLVYKHRGADVIKATSPKFNYAILIGAIITAVSGVLYLVDLRVGNPAMCCFRLYLPTFGVVFTFSPLVVKTYRVYRIFHNPELRKLTNLKDHVLLKGVAVMLGIQFVFVIISLATAIPQPDLHNSKSLSTPSHTIRVVECTTSTYFVFLTLVYLSAMVLYGLYLSVVTRNVPDKFNESRYIAFTVAFYLVYGLIILPLQLLANDPTSLAVLRGFGILLGVAISVGAMFVPKLLSIHGPSQPFFAYISSRAFHSGASERSGGDASANPSSVARHSIDQSPSIVRSASNLPTSTSMVGSPPRVSVSLQPVELNHFSETHAPHSKVDDDVEQPPAS